MEDITVTVTIHPNGTVTQPEGPADIAGIISQLLADESFITAVAQRVASLQPSTPRLTGQAEPASEPPLEEYVLPRYNFVDTFSKAQIYVYVWGLKTQVAQILARADIDPAEAIIMSDEELLNLRLMGAKSLAELKAKRRHIKKRALRFDLQRMRKAVRVVLRSGLLDDDENMQIDNTTYTLTCSASRFQKLAELLEQHKIRAHEVPVDEETPVVPETAEKVS